MNISFICTRTKLMFISTASHLASLWNRGLGKIGNGLFDPSMAFLFASFHRKQLGTMLLDPARNSALKLVNLPSITNYYRGLYGGEHKLAPHHTNVCKNSRLQKLKTRGRVYYCARSRKASWLVRVEEIIYRRSRDIIKSRCSAPPNSSSLDVNE